MEIDVNFKLMRRCQMRVFRDDEVREGWQFVLCAVFSFFLIFFLKKKKKRLWNLRLEKRKRLLWRVESQSASRMGSHELPQ